MNTANTASTHTPPSRIDWVDYAKGFCIIFVVMMHSTLGVGDAMEAEGWLHTVVTFAQPFRMPDFFMVAGLFLVKTIDKPWAKYLDKKVLHFVYFYLLWTVIQFGIKIPTYGAEYGYHALPALYLQTFYEPYSTLWFIYMLPIMFVATKVLRAIPWQLAFIGAAALEMAHAAGFIHTGNILVDEFAARYVYFFAGYIFASEIFKLADWAMQKEGIAIAFLGAWGVVNGIVVFTGYAQSAGISLILGGAGAVAVILVSALLSQVKLMNFLRYCGQNSIVVYLAFFFPMAVARTILIKLGIISDVGTISALTTAAAVIAPLILHWIIMKIGYGHFLFIRPKWASFDGRRTPAKLEPAE